MEVLHRNITILNHVLVSIIRLFLSKRSILVTMRLKCSRHLFVPTQHTGLFLLYLSNETPMVCITKSLNNLIDSKRSFEIVRERSLFIAQGGRGGRGGKDFGCITITFARQSSVIFLKFPPMIGS